MHERFLVRVPAIATVAGRVDYPPEGGRAAVPFCTTAVGAEQQLSQKSGLSVQELAQKLAQVLPQAVDTMTPDSTIPKA
jgi:hypothetical protein